ncbi:MAG: lysophospholipid acyltransferase family protein [Thermotogae bacterium]|nr:lysophospholipid acyltransferase family protein [Thermotogota bacterium]
MKLGKEKLLANLLSLWVKTLRIELILESEPLFPSVAVFWHGRMLILPVVFKDVADRVSVLISNHRDGELAAKVIRELGFKVVRGSTGRGKGGSSAFLKMLSLLEKGESVAITPDGPRGPREVMKEGAIKLSRKSGAPLLPITFGCSRGYKLSSWDRFLIPAPFSKCRVIVGRPIYPQDFESDEEMKSYAEKSLKELTLRAERF